jgi:agmatine/peptidylarginine deiminase
MTNDAHILLDEARRVKIGNAFFNGYGLIFKYSTLEEQDQGIAKQEILYTISDLKYNDDDEIEVGGTINYDGDYRVFFLENMSSVSMWQHV